MKGELDGRGVWEDVPGKPDTVRRPADWHTRGGAERTNMRCGIPAEYHSKPPGLAWPFDERTNRCADNWNGSPYFLTFYGPPGTGKSTLACELLRRLHVFEDPAKRAPDYYTADMLASHLWNALPSERSELETRLELCRVLCVDDLGMADPASNRGGRVLETAAEILMRRHMTRRPSIVVTNRHPKDFAQWQPALADRLRGGVVCLMDGPSWRGRALEAVEDREQ